MKKLNKLAFGFTKPNIVISYEYNGIKVSEIGPDEYRIEFLNGMLDIDLKNKEPLVLGTGCGSGKTTAFCLLMLLRLSKGILYVTDRTDDLDRVYNWLMENAVGELFYEEDGYTQFVLKKEDIVNLHNNPITDDKGNVVNGVDIDRYNNDPSYIQNARIVLATSYKFTHEYPENIMLFGRNTSQSISINPFETSVMGKVVKGSFIPPRGTVLIDELITCDLMSRTYTRVEIEAMGIRRSYIYVGKTNSKYIHGDQYMTYTRSTVGETMGVYRSILRGRPELSFSKSGTTAANLKDQMMVYSIHSRYDDIIKDIYENDKGQYTHTHNILSYVMDNMRTNIIMAEGTAEYLMCDKVNELGQVVEKSKFKLLTYPNKYNSPINIERFEYPFDTRVVKNSELQLVGTDKDTLTPKLTKVSEEINKILKSPKVNKVLVFGWMNLKSKSDIKPELNGSAIMKYMLNEDFNMVEYIRNRVNVPEGKSVVFSHYQSGEDKATNDYRDFDTIIFSGYFRIPELAIARMNKYYGYSTNSFMYTVHQVIQAISRTRIRLHKGLPINVYFSSDWDGRVIDEIGRYLGSNINPSGNIVVTDRTLDWIKDKWKPAIMKLGNYDPNFMNAVLTKSSYTLNITLDDLYNLIPMDRKRIRDYRYLTNYLDTLGITSNIHI